jgi:hypothetical protein
VGTPRGLQGRLAAFADLLGRIVAAIQHLFDVRADPSTASPAWRRLAPVPDGPLVGAPSSTGC